jgi:hypothetical protein
MWRDTSLDRPLPAEESADTLYHVSPVGNRASIMEHGLDWRRMGPAPGLASGRHVAEEPANYLARDLDEAGWFVSLCNHTEPVDIWEIEATGLDLVLTGDGWVLSRELISPERLTLLEKDLDPGEKEPPPTSESPGSGGFFAY